MQNKHKTYYRRHFLKKKREEEETTQFASNVSVYYNTFLHLSTSLAITDIFC